AMPHDFIQRMTISDSLFQRILAAVSTTTGRMLKPATKCKLRQQPCALFKSLDGNRVQLHVFHWTVLSVALGLGDAVHNVLTLDDLAEDGVIAGEPVGCRNSNEELAAVSIGAGVGHGEFAGFVEFVRRALGFVRKLIAGTAGASAQRISSLDHEIGNHAMEDSVVVEWHVGLLSAAGVGPLARAFGEFNEILHRVGSVLFKKTADDLSHTCIKSGVKSGLSGHGYSFLWT